MSSNCYVGQREPSKLDFAHALASVSAIETSHAANVEPHVLEYNFRPLTLSFGDRSEGIHGRNLEADR